MALAIPKPENVARLIYFVRGETVMLDSDLATLYGVSTRALNQAVKRNRSRFPADFMFQVTAEEWSRLRSHSVTSDSELLARTVPSRGGARYRPHAFTEQGVAMLSSVLRSPRAVEVNIAIMRTFVQLRRLMDSNRELGRKIEAMEKRYDEKCAAVFNAIKQLIGDDGARKAQPKRDIG